MKIRLLLLFILLSSSFPFSKDLPSMETHSASKTPSGSYTLVNGTQGCPLHIDWNGYCGGFILNIETLDGSFQTERFCDLNRRVKTEKKKKFYGTEETRIETKKNENIVQKKTKVVMISAKSQSTEIQEDTVILDPEKSSFLWEHSKNGRGTSCLYSK